MKLLFALQDDDDLYVGQRNVSWFWSDLQHIDPGRRHRPYVLNVRGGRFGEPADIQFISCDVVHDYKTVLFCCRRVKRQRRRRQPHWLRFGF
jgi:hypothetical protein